jgi:4-hydroxybenzoate polyprenyltransferase
MHKHAVLQCTKVISIFSLFAFITSMAREIIKDIEDFKGDKETGGNTMPIHWGIAASKLTVFFLLVITLLLLLFVIYNTLKVNRELMAVDIVYIILALVLPLIILILMIIKATEPLHYKRASLFLKFIMLMGLGFSVIFYYL